MIYRASRGEYRSVQSFARDLRRMVRNALIYNEVLFSRVLSTGTRGYYTLCEGVSFYSKSAVGIIRREGQRTAHGSSSKKRELLCALWSRGSNIPCFFHALRGKVWKSDRRENALFYGQRTASGVVHALLYGTFPTGNSRWNRGKERYSDRAGVWQ